MLIHAEVAADGLPLIAKRLADSGVELHCDNRSLSILGPDAPDAAFLGRAETWATWLEGLRRFAVGLYLASIAFGLATIIKAIGFLTLRMKELTR